MLSADHLLDRGRLLIGALLVIPLGAMLTGIGRPDHDAPAWLVASVTANPITVTAPTAEDVLAELTSPAATGSAAAGTTPPGTGASGAASPAGASGAAAPAGTASTGAATAGTPAQATTEVGSESDDAAGPAAMEIPGTAPNAALAAQLRKSQSRFAPATPAASPSEGPMPFANPAVGFYPTPPTATHVFPVVGGASFTNDWGGPRPGGRSHQGIDLFAATGTPVVAISDGTLFKVGWNRIGGWRFWLRDRWGNEFYHAHLSAFAPAAREGAVVKAGTVIGFVGNTGDAKTTPPHLHFEIHPSGGDPIPPFSYVSAWPRL
jgi:murein DD-endopeptidase MepM/ murein hydrolase activator NlpD